jgi:hypothetical protein
MSPIESFNKKCNAYYYLGVDLPLTSMLRELLPIFEGDFQTRERLENIFDEIDLELSRKAEQDSVIGSLEDDLQHSFEERNDLEYKLSEVEETLSSIRRLVKE